MVSVDVGKVRFIIGDVLEGNTRFGKLLVNERWKEAYFDSSHSWTMLDAVANRGSVR